MIKLIKSTFYKEKATLTALCKFISKAERLSIGVMCTKFENNFSLWQKRKHSVMFNSGSSANLGLLQALANLKKIKRGDAVAFSALTWATNVMPLLNLGLIPIPIDVEMETLNISPKSVAEAYKKDKFKCLFITNLLGYSDNILEIQKFCKKNNILLIEDNCEALGSEYKGIKLGNFGYASTFSFYVGHHLSTIEGGMVSTDDLELDSELRMVRSHGWDRHLPENKQKELRNKHGLSEFHGKYAFYDIAYNLRPTDIQGFLGVNQLRYLDEMVNKREENYKKLEKIYSNPDFIKIKTNNMSRISNFAFPVICKSEGLIGKYIQLAEKAEIEVRPIVGGDMTTQPFFKKYVESKYSLPNIKHIHFHGFYFGNNAEMTKKEIEFLVKTLS